MSCSRGTLALCLLCPSWWKCRPKSLSKGWDRPGHWSKHWTNPLQSSLFQRHLDFWESRAGSSNWRESTKLCTSPTPDSEPPKSSSCSSFHVSWPCSYWGLATWLWRDPKETGRVGGRWRRIATRSGPWTCNLKWSRPMRGSTQKLRSGWRTLPCSLCDTRLERPPLNTSLQKSAAWNTSLRSGPSGRTVARCSGLSWRGSRWHRKICWWWIQLWSRSEGGRTGAGLWRRWEPICPSWVETGERSRPGRLQVVLQGISPSPLRYLWYWCNTRGPYHRTVKYFHVSPSWSCCWTSVEYRRCFQLCSIAVKLYLFLFPV